MNNSKEKTTIPDSSVGADEDKSLSINTCNIINENFVDVNSEEEFEKLQKNIDK